MLACGHPTCADGQGESIRRELNPFARVLGGNVEFKPGEVNLSKVGRFIGRLEETR